MYQLIIDVALGQTKFPGLANFRKPVSTVFFTALRNRFSYTVLTIFVLLGVKP